MPLTLSTWVLHEERTANASRRAALLDTNTLSSQYLGNLVYTNLTTLVASHGHQHRVCGQRHHYFEQRRRILTYIQGAGCRKMTAETLVAFEHALDEHPTFHLL